MLTLVEAAVPPSLMDMGRDLCMAVPQGCGDGAEGSAENALEPKWNVLGEASKWWP